MADTKLSALVELATTPAVGDEVYIRDVSEAAAAESKRITVANLMAALVAHAASHQNGGGDEISVAALSGLLADDQHVLDAEVLAVAAALVHAARHQNGGADEISLAGLDGEPSTLTTHKADTTTAHGAVSAATANKHVVRDAAARAKFAAPNAAGDALIKGTRVTTAELPAMTDEKYWVGTGGNVEERDVPAAGAALTIAETEVFDGNSPAAWADLDLSGVIGSQATLVLLKVGNETNIVNSIAFRKDGETDEIYCTVLEHYGGVSSTALTTNCYVYLLVITSATGVIEWKAEAAAAATTIDVVAYIK